MESIYRWLAGKLPRKLVYFAVIRAWVNATSGPYSGETPIDMTIKDTLNRWVEIKKGKAT
jgi:hypothetical protein